MKERLNCLFCRQCQLHVCPECSEPLDDTHLVAGKYICNCNSRMVRSMDSSFMTGRFLFPMFPVEHIQTETVEQYMEDPPSFRNRISKMMDPFWIFNPFDRDLTSKSRCANFGTLLTRFLIYFFLPVLLLLSLPFWVFIFFLLFSRRGGNSDTKKEILLELPW